MKHVNEAVDKTRKDENKKLKNKGIIDLNGTRYMWLYSSDNLPEKYRERFNEGEYPESLELIIDGGR